MNSSESNTSYQNLFNAWREELSSKDLTSLNLNFIKSYQQVIENFSSGKEDQKFINQIFIKRIEFLIQNLIDLRKNKIINSIFEKKDILTSYLSKQELIFYDYLKNGENILQNNSIMFSNQMKEFLFQNSNINIEESVDNQKSGISPNPPQVENTRANDEIQVVFLKDLEEFVYLNNKKYGPFKKNELAKVPKEVFYKILNPKNFAQLKN